MSENTNTPVWKDFASNAKKLDIKLNEFGTNSLSLTLMYVPNRKTHEFHLVISLNMQIDNRPTPKHRQTYKLASNQNADAAQQWHDMEILAVSIAKRYMSEIAKLTKIASETLEKL